MKDEEAVRIRNGKAVTEMGHDRKPRFRATRTTPDPYPPHPVLVFTDKSLEEAQRASCVSIEDLDGFKENALGSELSEWIDLSKPRFTAKINAGTEGGGEVVMVLGHLTYDELEALPPTTCIEIGHVSGEGPSELVPRGQVTEVTPFDLDSALAAYADLKDDAVPEPVQVGVGAVRSAARKFGRAS